ncbi:hypothetical protein COV82_00655 [Candidatus Peregrinibacteria bacterium CG11_big_fil_rev_8_21_14_0_20_46_8]|nr:MAG: hypothetical protein COV82_00655 [Candidatus Peregrinibacteria bacterium CG11_big_fil_rev_8_21_14_0_20_46_8]
MFSLIILILIVLTLSGFFSGAEAALLTVNPGEVEDMMHKKMIGAKTLHTLTKKTSRAIFAIVIMNNAVNIIGSILVGQSVIALYGDAFLGVASTALTFAVIFFSEIIPKSLGMHYASAVAPKIAPILTALMWILYPIIFLLEWITNMLQKGERKIGTESQIRSLVRLGWRRGHIEADEGLLIHRVFLLNDKSAEDIMIPRSKIIGLEHHVSIAEAAKIAMKHHFARLPVFKGDLDHIEGMVLKSDLVEALARDEHDKQLREMIRPLPKVLCTMKADDLLLLFQKEHTHIAVVKDHGKTVGLVTLEEVLEELVGEIIDEKDAKKMRIS